MELNSEHRKALLAALETAKEDKALSCQCAKQEEEIHRDTYWFDIGIFLASERIKLIEKSLIENEIDF